MRKTLRAIAFSAGIISVVTSVVLGLIYLDDITRFVKKIKEKLPIKIVTNKKNKESGDE